MAGATKIYTVLTKNLSKIPQLLHIHTCNWLITLVDNQLLGSMQSQAITGFRTILSARASIIFSGYKTSTHDSWGRRGSTVSSTLGGVAFYPNQIILKETLMKMHCCIPVIAQGWDFP